MKARLLKDSEGQIKLLCANGSISESSITVLANLLLTFKNADHVSGADGDWAATHGDMALYPGETLAYVTDDYNLVIMDFSAFEPLINESYKMTSYISLGEWARLHNKSREIVKVWCRSGRLVGCQKKANRWLIPKDAPYPVPPERQRDGNGRKKK